MTSATPTCGKVDPGDGLPDFDGRLRLLLLDCDLEKLAYGQIFDDAVVVCKHIYRNVGSIQVAITYGLIELGRRAEKNNIPSLRGSQ